MKQAMVIMAIFLIALGFVFIVMGYAQREGPITPDGNGNGEDGYPPEYTPPDGTPPDGSPPDGDGGSPPIWWREPSKPQSTFNLFGYTVTVYELVGAIMCIIGAVIFVTGGKL